MTLDDILVDDFKEYFTRDFPYYTAGDSTNYVTDEDIEKAFLQAQANFNTDLFSSDNILKISYLHLVAHYLVVDFQMSAQGLQSVGYNPVTSRSVGSVSESYQLPEWISKGSFLAEYTTTRYGQKYLSLIRPLMIGNVGLAAGYTTP